MTEEKIQVEQWLNKISEAEKFYREYYELIDETRKFYKDNKSGKYNIFWSTVETLKPFLYFKQPKFYIERSDKTSGVPEKMACKMLEKALKWDLEQFDFDSVIKYARNDFLISGAGIVWEQYCPKLENIPDPLNPSQEISIKSGETVESVYIDPRYFLTDTQRVGVWEDITWVARKIYMNYEQFIREFDENLWDERNEIKEICIYEVWDKISQKTYWISPQIRDYFLKVNHNILKLSTGFPCPKPIFSTTTNDSILPMPDYCMIKEMLNELNGINSRMKMTMQALKISGAYDKSFPELADILSKDVTLVAVNDFVKLRENGGIRGIIDFAPIEQYVVALEQLAVRRQEVISSIFDITGVSDIMRGSSNGTDTATAVIKKTNFGTLRNQDRQNDMQRFIRDLLRLKAEIICEMFEPQKLLSFLDTEQKKDKENTTKALQILKTEKLRGMMFRVETDTLFNKEEEIDKTVKGIETLNQTVTSALSTVTQQPLLLPLYKAMTFVMADALPHGRIFENTLEKVFSDLELFIQKQEELKQQQALQPQPQNPFLELDAQKVLLKAKELEIKQNLEQQRIDLENKQLQADINLKLQKLETEKQKDSKK